MVCGKFIFGKFHSFMPFLCNTFEKTYENSYRIKRIKNRGIVTRVNHSVIQGRPHRHKSENSKSSKKLFLVQYILLIHIEESA